MLCESPGKCYLSSATKMKTQKHNCPVNRRSPLANLSQHLSAAHCRTPLIAQLRPRIQNGSRRRFRESVDTEAGRGGSSNSTGQTPYKHSRNFPVRMPLSMNASKYLGETEGDKTWQDPHKRTTIQVSNMPLEVQDVGTIKYTLGDLLGNKSQVTEEVREDQDGEDS
jgi:hypothetical protein